MISGLHPVTSEAVVEMVVEMTPWIIALLLISLTHLGSVLLIVPALGIAYLRRPKLVAPWLGAVTAYYGLMAGIKSLNSATRPDVAPPITSNPYPEALSWWYEHATAISTTSFPSGNVMVATVVAGLLTLDLDIGTMRQRALVTGSLVVTVAYSRVALAVHYPVDAVAGILLGLALLGAIYTIRGRVADEAAGVFGLAVVCTFFGVWATTGLTALPTMESLAGSNRPIAFGAAVGALVGWELQKRYAGMLTRQTATVLSCVLVLIAIAAYVGFGEFSNPLVTMVRAGIFSGAMIALPWVFPNRVESVTQTAALSRSN